VCWCALVVDASTLISCVVVIVVVIILYLLFYIAWFVCGLIGLGWSVWLLPVTHVVY